MVLLFLSIDSVQDIDEVKKGKTGTKPKARKKEEEKGGASEEKCKVSNFWGCTQHFQD